MIAFCNLLDAKTGHVQRQLDIRDVPAHLARADQVIWIDVVAPGRHDLAVLGATFGFHPLALEDCAKAHQRPKLEQYGGYLFFVLYAVSCDVPETRLVASELAIFLGKNYVVTVHQHPAPVVETIERRWEQAEAFEETASYLAYLLIDAAVDTYFPTLDLLGDRLEALEEGAFSGADAQVIGQVFQVKKQLLLMRRLVTPLRDVFLVMLRREDAYFGGRSYLYFQDVLDHLLRVSDAVDTYRDLVSSAVEAYQSAVSNRTNDVMKTLTVFSTVLMSMALVAGIYGMNFARMPELSWRLGYPFSLALMVLVGGTVVGLFKWRRYF